MDPELRCVVCHKRLNLQQIVMCKCNYCEKYYCKLHRLPESHTCNQTKLKQYVLPPETKVKYIECKAGGGVGA